MYVKDEQELKPFAGMLVMELGRDMCDNDAQSRHVGADVTVSVLANDILLYFEA